MNKTNRRHFIQRGATAAAAVAAVAIPADVAAQAEKPVKKVHYRNGRKPDKTPLFNGTVSYGNLLFIAGVGYHSEGDIKVHTKAVLDQIQQQLESAGSSMEKVLKCPVLFLGLSLPEHGYHAPNENFDWDQASGGIAAFAKYFTEVAALKS